MRFPSLTDTQRMAAAKVSGAIQRLGYTYDRNLPLDAKLAELYGITRDPAVFGHCLGDCLASIDQGETRWQPCADLLRIAGADETAAADQMAWRRWQHERMLGGGFML